MRLRSIVRASSGASHRRPFKTGLCVAAVTCALVMSLASLAVALDAAPGFPDVPASHPHYDAITALAARGVIGGYGDGTFAPENDVTRQQFAKMIVIAGGYPVSEADVCPFTDVQKSDAGSLYPDNYVAVCAAKGITTGKTPSTFDPTGKVTRYQVISMVVRMANDRRPGLLPAPPASFTATGTWGTDPTHGANAAKAEYNGLLAGLDLAALSPTSSMNRGEVAQVLFNLLGRLGTTTTTSAVPTTTTTTRPGAWIDLKPPAAVPPARSAYSMAYDPVSRTVILFGGFEAGSSGVFFNDTWAYDPAVNAWSELKPSGQLPPARLGGAMVYDSTGGKMLLFGGRGGGSAGQLFNDTWAYDPASNRWTKLTPSGGLPPARYFHGLFYDPHTATMILFGGDAGSSSAALLNDTWAYDPAANTWTELHPTGSLPSARNCHTLVYDAGTGRGIMFGGEGSTSPSTLELTNDTWAYDPAATSWTKLDPTGTQPPARASYSMAYDSAAHRVLLFGGWNGTSRTNDTWAYDAIFNAWTKLNPSGSLPSARCCNRMIFDPAGARAIIFGGFDGYGNLSDTWAF